MQCIINAVTLTDRSIKMKRRNGHMPSMNRPKNSTASKSNHKLYFPGGCHVIRAWLFIPLACAFMVAINVTIASTRNRTRIPDTSLFSVPVIDVIDTHTGSFSNCTVEKRKDEDSDDRQNPVRDSHSGAVQVSCHQVRYVVPIQSFQKAGPIITGVLSNASKDGLARRLSIRKTWAKRRMGIFFLVAGPWHQIQDEYNKHGDLIWIDKDEVYDGENSVLTFKSYSFLSIVHIMAEKLNLYYTHVFKTDDDSYLDLDLLYEELMGHHGAMHRLYGRPIRAGNHIRARPKNSAYRSDYVGQCQIKNRPVVRDSTYKWPLTIDTYPENYLPPYCQGAGYAVSRAFINCAHTQNHIADARFMPLEDVAVGILAERCGIKPTLPVLGEIRVHRYKSQEASERIRNDDSNATDLIPTVCMSNKIVQHRVINAHDMRKLHKTVLDPKYCETTRQEREEKILKRIEKGLEWFG